MPFFNKTLDLAFPRVLAASVQGLPAETTIRPTVAAGGSDRANWQKQAVTQQDFEVLVRDDRCLAVLRAWEHERSGPWAPVGPEVGSLFVIKGAKKGFFVLVRDLLAQDALKFRHWFLKQPLPAHGAKTQAASLGSCGFCPLHVASRGGAFSSKAGHGSNLKFGGNALKAQSPTAEEGRGGSGGQAPVSQAACFSGHTSYGKLVRAQRSRGAVFVWEQVAQSSGEQVVQLLNPRPVFVVGPLDVSDA